MRVIQTVFGVFHHFDLATELQKRGHLEKVYSTWPWARLKREGLPKERVESFPWIHTAAYFYGRSKLHRVPVAQQLHLLNTALFDRWTMRRLRALQRQGTKVDALIAISGSGTRTGRLLQQTGGIFICDRGSSHHRYQRNIVAEEDRIWNVERESTSDLRVTAIEEEQYELADAISVPSSFAIRSFVEMGVPREKLRLIPYGVRLERFRPVADPPTDSFDVLFAGSVSLRKGVPYLLQAFAQLKHPNKHLRIAGAIDHAVKAVFDRLPNASVEWLGAVPQNDLITLMSKSHVLVLPSIEEGLALVQAQAMACGCPVIASHHTGSEDLYTDGVEGFIVPIRDAASLADRMQRIADDPGMHQRMREASLNRVRHLGGWSEYGAKWEKTLQELLAENS